MARQPYFLTKKQFNCIIQKYGGGRVWSLCANMSEYGMIVFMDSVERMLSINLKFEGSEGNFQYIEIRLANNVGQISRIDRYEYTSASRTQFEFMYTEEYGTVYNEFRPISKPSAATKRNMLSNTKKLEQRLTDVMKLLEQSEKRIHTMTEQAEQSFLNSPTYHQMQQELDFYKSLNKLNEIHLANAKKQAIVATEHIQQIYKDNIRMCEHGAELNYWIGITECWHDAKDYENLRSEIRTLKGNIEQKELAVADRDAEIHRLQLLTGEMKCQIANTPDSCYIEHKELELLRAENNELKKCIAGLEEQLFSLSSAANLKDHKSSFVERDIEHHKTGNLPKKMGRPPVVDSQKIDSIIKLSSDGYSIRHIAEQLDMSVGNVHRYIKLYGAGALSKEK